MSYFSLLKAENEAVSNRLQLALNRIEEIPKENITRAPYQEYFQTAAEFIQMLRELLKLVWNGEWKRLPLEKHQEWNQRLYEDILEPHYQLSYANPAFACHKLGKEYGKLLCFLYTEIRAAIVYAIEGRMQDFTFCLELFLEIYQFFQTENSHTKKEIRDAIYYYVGDYSELTIDYGIREQLDPSLDFAARIILEENLEDIRYLYLYGEYISENEIKMAQYLNRLSQEKINAMARTYTEGFRKGFEVNQMDLSKKSLVNIRFPIGFERMVKAAIFQFEKMGLKPILYRAAVASIHKGQHKIGWYSTSPNRQYDYDHRFDQALYLDKAFLDRKLAVMHIAYEKYKEAARKLAGPAVIEPFGLKEFNPKEKAEAYKLDKKQQKQSIIYRRESRQLVNDYIPEDEVSFTIIAYPLPEIGERFEDIFEETIKVNTLDSQKYEKIQTKLIEALDQGEYAQVLGTGKNGTDLKIMLHDLEHPESQTNFENCRDDMNIPVGEVFTSPVLKGTNGTLFVSEVFINGLLYKELRITFQDGMIKDYICSNFEKEEENRRLIKETLLYNHESLPIGEFAIGTNTTAYKMAIKYGIFSKLPILIAEKTGPHFAIGDTCYCMSEEKAVFNPDGKEIIARDNERSVLRKDAQKKDEAYFFCHTDITIPYQELTEISVYKKNGEKLILLQDGRFVLSGTEELNEALDELDKESLAGAMKMG